MHGLPRSHSSWNPGHSWPGGCQMRTIQEVAGGQAPGGFTLRQLGIAGTSLPAGPWPNSHSRLPVIVRIAGRGQLVADEGHGRSVPTQVLSPLSNTAALLFGSV